MFRVYMVFRGGLYSLARMSVTPLLGLTLGADAPIGTLIIIIKLGLDLYEHLLYYFRV